MSAKGAEERVVLKLSICQASKNYSSWLMGKEIHRERK
jgi:hypothetical protein